MTGRRFSTPSRARIRGVSGLELSRRQLAQIGSFVSGNLRFSAEICRRAKAQSVSYWVEAPARTAASFVPASPAAPFAARLPSAPPVARATTTVSSMPTTSSHALSEAKATLAPTHQSGQSLARNISSVLAAAGRHRSSSMPARVATSLLLAGPSLETRWSRAMTARSRANKCRPPVRRAQRRSRRR